MATMANVRLMKEHGLWEAPSVPTPAEEAKLRERVGIEIGEAEAVERWSRGFRDSWLASTLGLFYQPT